jgi:hypothetical protein
VFLWLTGAANYLWTTFFVLCFILPYVIYINNGKPYKYKYALTFGIAILGVIAGWCNENNSGGAVLLTTFFLIYCKLFKTKIQPWMVSGYIGIIVGYSFLLLAPGNYIRMQNFYDPSPYYIILLARFNNVATLFRNYFTTPVVIFIILVTLLIVSNADKKRIYISFAYFITSIAVHFAMVLSPFIPERSMFGATIFMIIACSHCLSGLSWNIVRNKIFSICLIAVLGFHFLTLSISGIFDIASTYRHVNNFNSYIEQEITKGNKNIIVSEELIPEPSTPWNARYLIPEITHFPDFWVNTTSSDFYGIESIKRSD